jgi:hypothetical protein
MTFTKENKMIKTEMPDFAKELSSAELVEFVQRKTNSLELIGCYAYALSLVWSMSGDKLKETVVRMIEENNK